MPLRPLHPNAPPPAGLTRRDVLSAGWGRRETAAPPSHYIRVHRRAMACRFEVALPGDRAGDIAAAQSALEQADRLEALLSIFRESSEISRINHATDHTPIAVSDEVFDLLARCVELSSLTDGAFDITATAFSRCWGFLRREGRLPGDDEIAAARQVVGSELLSLDQAAGTVSVSRPGVTVNLGAIGKGFAVQAIGTALWGSGVRHALVSAGASSVIALGGPEEGWIVDITSPAAGRSPLARLRLRNAALATSGAGEQFVEVDGVRYGHVIDPRTGRPATGILSASVVTSDAATADALATAFFVGGIELARQYCDAHPGTLALITPDDGSLRPLVVGRYLGAVVEEQG